METQFALKHEVLYFICLIKQLLKNKILMTSWVWICAGLLWSKWDQASTVLNGIPFQIHILSISPGEPPAHLLELHDLLQEHVQQETRLLRKR